MTAQEMMRAAIAAVGDDPASVVCFYQALSGRRYSEKRSAPIRCTVDELPTREFDDGYGSVESEPVIGFSDRFVYVHGCYDGAEWIQAVPRHPESVDDGLPCVGGG